ncbi:MAG: hypothetical protein HN544_05080, partial [Euryarchaeota archaeon]|nr:hypothetical protein [Euryarchaeota archaeon]
MNRKVALFISVILLTQVASYSFNQITPQIDWQEPLQGDSTWEVSGRNNTTGGNNTGGNNTTGNSAPVISNMTISPSNPVVGDTLYCSWDYFDQDNDADQTTYWWYANGTYLSNWSNSWLDTSSLQVGSQIYCAGDAYDGANWGNTISSQNVTLGSNNTGGNNTGTMESVWGESFATQNGSYSQISWEAYNLVNNTNYNVTFDLWEYDNASNNLTLISTMNYTAFNSSSSYSNFAYDVYNSTAGGYWTNTYTSIGCYYVSINLFENDNGLILDNYGFDYDVGTNCSNTAGNNTGGNNNPEISSVYSTLGNYSSSDEIDLHWIARDLD